MQRIYVFWLITGLIFFGSIDGNCQVFSGAGGSIPDNGPPVDFPISVSGLSPSNITASFGLLKVCLDITHTYDADLTVSLLSPDGTLIDLFSGIGGGGDNFTSTCLGDNFPNSIGTASAPFTGNFKPMGFLGNVNNGQNGNGTWKLRVQDTWAQDVGTLNGWSIEFSSNVSGPFTVDSTNLPLFIINTNGQAIPNEPKITADLRIIDYWPGGMNHPTDLPNVYTGKIGIEIRGSYSATLPQKPYGFETRDINGNNANVSPFGFPAENDWVLLANYNDKNFMRNTLAFELSRRMGRYASRTELCEVIINNDYKGIYIFGEKIKRDIGRVDVSRLDVDDNAGDSLTGGYIIKVDYHDATNSWLSPWHPIGHPAKNVYFVYYYPKPDSITPQQKTYIQGFMNAFETALYGPDFQDPVLGYRNYIDPGSFIDYFIVNELARNNDGFKKSRYFFKDKDSKGGLLNAGPVWDFDWAWKNINECFIFAATDGSGWAHHINDCNPDVNSPGWMIRLLQDSTFANDLNCRYFDLRTTILDTTWLFGYIDSVHNYVSEAQMRHYTKWPTLGINVGTPEIGPQPLTYAGEIQKFKDWIWLRLQWLDANMPGNCPPVSSNADNRIVFRVFPNPANDWIHVESSNKIVVVELFDLSGKRVFSQEYVGKYSVLLHFSAFSKGMYILKAITEDEQVFIRKLHIE